METLAQALPSSSRPSPRPRRPISTAPPGSMPVTAPAEQCPQCHDLGYVREDVPLGHPHFGKLLRCGCKAGEDARRLQALSGLIGAELVIRLKDLDTAGRPGTEQMLRACRAFIERPSGMVTLWGGVGNAKTMALQAVVNELQALGAVYVTAFDLLSYIRTAFSARQEVQDDDAYSRLLRFERVKILAIDELDKVRVTDWVTEQLTDLIDKRYRGGIDGSLGTLLAMNRDPADQPEWIASRLLDRRNRIVHNADSDLRPYLEAA